MTEELQVLSLESTPAASIEELSPEFMRRAVERLGIASLVLAGAMGVGFAIRLVAVEVLGGEPPPWLAAGTVGGLILLCLSLLMHGVCKQVRDPVRVLRLGLAYQLLGALCIALPQYAGPHLVHSASGNTVSWIGVWILLFPLLVPSPLGLQVAVSVASASLPPLVFVCWSAATAAGLPPASVLFTSFAGPYVCAALAVVPAWLMLRLARRVTSAQEQARELGSYRLVQLLGQGGMGEVWRAEHRLLARPAAIKLIKRDVLGSKDRKERADARARFEREAQTIAQLTSPSTVALFDFGVTKDGDLYYVMELLDGVDLETLVRDFGRLPPRRVVHLLVQACESLAEAHEAGLVHRDVKPANLLLCKQGVRHDVLKVLDFGLVGRTKTQEISSSSELKLTGAGFVVGTPGYMAPEQARGRELDARADIYALACVGYWLLTGQMVFDTESSVEMLLHHVKTEPEPLSNLVDGVPPALEELLMECLAKSPDDRPSDMLVLRQRLLELDLAPWGRAEADAWWQENAELLASYRISPPAASTETQRPRALEPEG